MYHKNYNVNFKKRKAWNIHGLFITSTYFYNFQILSKLILSSEKIVNHSYCSLEHTKIGKQHADHM